MRKVAGSISPVVAIDRKLSKPLHRQVCDGYKTAILRGEMRAGQQVPSTRSLSLELGISRIPILNAYSQLLAEGYFETRAGSGTFVSEALPPHLHEHTDPPDDNTSGVTRPGSRILSQRSLFLPPRGTAPWTYGVGPFSVGQLGFDHFPIRVWSNLIARHARRVRASSLNYGDPMGLKEFREAIAAYLRTARAVQCEPSQVLIVSGSQQALDVSARALMDPGDRVWIEEPSYALMRHAFELASCALVPVPVDENGLIVAAGIRACREAKAAYVTPSHQFPLGFTMDASRRLQLLDWAKRSGSWIIEDDYDSEYRFESMPVASLQGLDHHARVIYIGTFSKTLFPSLRLGYLVVPPDLVERFAAVKRTMDIFPSTLHQEALADFISDGHFARHIRKTRLLYGERRNVLVSAIRDVFGTQLEVIGSEAGMHLVVLLPPGFKDTDVSARAAACNLWLWPLSSSYVGMIKRQGFILGFAGTAAAEIPAAVRRLKQVLTV